jgi:hypothetical protein
MTPEARRRAVAILYGVVALLHLLPIWRVQYVPTVDGPSHLYNAVVLAEWTPEMARIYFVDARPHPNWLTHLLLVAGLKVLPPVAAEKAVVSLIVLLFLAGCWSLAGAVNRDSRLYAFLAMPLAWHLLFQVGFYNYSLGVALVPLALASWWRRRERASWGHVTRVAVWLVVLYFAHVFAAAAAIGLIAVAWIVSLALRGWREQWRLGVAFVPAALLMLWFFLQPKPPGGTWTWDGALLWMPILKTALLLTFDLRQLTWGTILAIAFAVLILLTFAIENIDWQHRRLVFGERDLFLLLAVLGIGAYLAAPLSVEEGLLLKARVLIFPYLVILPWLTPRLARLPLAVVFALAVAANVFFIRDAWKRNDKVIAAAVEPLRAASRHRTIVPLIFDRSSPHSTLPLLGHAMSHGAAERQLVDLGNYEAGLPYFPVQFRPNLERPQIIDLEAAPGDYDPARWAELVHHVYTWKMPPDAPVARRLAEQYDIAAEQGDARLYVRRR